MKLDLSGLFNLLRLIASRWGVYLLMGLGLAMGFAAATVVALYVHDEMTYDRFIPDGEQVFLVSANYGPQGKPLVASDVTPAGVARWLKADAAAIDQVARLNPVEWPMRSPRRYVKERFYWADPNFFDVVKLPVLYGDLKTALRAPGSVVLTERMARAYFGRADAIGQPLATKDGAPLHVTAVLRDFPGNTHLDREIFVSGRTDYAMLMIFDRNPEFLWPSCYTYATLKPGVASKGVGDTLFNLSRYHWQGPNNLPEGFEFVRLVDLHLQPQADGQMKPRGHLNIILTLCVVAVAILALAAINVSGLVLAETNERGYDMAIRTALGARRQDLITHVLAETVSVSLIGALISVAVVERLLPGLNGALDLDLRLWDHPVVLVASLAASALILGVWSGLYPALVVSAPYATRAFMAGRSGAFLSSDRWMGWVIAQLALVIVLLISSHTMYRQWAYATGDALNFRGQDVLMVRYSDNAAANAAFSRNVRSIAGVISAAESFGVPTTDFVRPGWVNRPDGTLVALTRNSVHPDYFKVFDIPLLAGRNLSGTFLTPETPAEVLINEATVTALGYASPHEALGREIVYDTDRTTMRSRIVGVVPDVRFATVYEPVGPMIFDNFSKYFTQINLRIDGGKAGAALKAIDELWRRDTAGAVPVERRFFDDYLLGQYHDLHQQLRVFNLMSAVAITLSVLGLTGLSVFLTRHQVREMAIRRALGATFTDIFLQRVTPFLRPLAIANLIAWPLAWLVLDVWLKAFAAHVQMSWVSFIGAGAITVVVALATIAFHSAATAGKVPIQILRQE